MKIVVKKFVIRVFNPETSSPIYFLKDGLGFANVYSPLVATKCNSHKEAEDFIPEIFDITWEISGQNYKPFENKVLFIEEIYVKE